MGAPGPPSRGKDTIQLPPLQMPMMLRTRPLNELEKTTCPVAMHNRGPAQESAVHSLCPRHRGWTSGWTHQCLPFQRSARIEPGPAGLPTRPTAVHAVGDVHATAFNTPSPGEGSTVQLAALPGAAHHSAIANTPAIARALLITATLAGAACTGQGLCRDAVEVNVTAER